MMRLIDFSICVERYIFVEAFPTFAHVSLPVYLLRACLPPAPHFRKAWGPHLRIGYAPMSSLWSLAMWKVSLRCGSWGCSLFHVKLARNSGLLLFWTMLLYGASFLRLELAIADSTRTLQVCTSLLGAPSNIFPS